MPKSKRARVLPTSKTRPDRKTLIKRLHSNIQSAIDTYPYLWAFSVQNMRNSLIKGVRTQLLDSRIFMGKTKVMVHALGATAETEYAKGLSALTKYVSGEVGLLFTSRSEAEVKAFFAGFREVDFARAGNRAERGFRIPKGVELRTASGVEGMEGEEDPIPVSMEPTLRKLGVPTRIVKGKVVLEESGADEGEMEEDDGEGGNGYVVCRPGDILDSRQTTLLKIFGVRMAEFRIGLKAVWEKASGTVREIGAMELDGMATDS